MTWYKMNNLLLDKIDKKSLKYLWNLRLNHSDSSKVKYPKSTQNIMNDKHAYYKIHPWRSKKQFIKDMLKQVIYNKDGLIAINKPYGISIQPAHPDTKRIPSGIPSEVPYTMKDALPELSTELGYSTLKIVKTPEKFTSGVVLLATDDKVSEAVNKSFRRAEGMRIIPRTYWTLTRGIPIHKEGEQRLAIKFISPPEKDGKPQPDIVSNYSINERKRKDIKVFNVQFRVLSYGADNLGSLVEIKASTSQWHAIRLFAATVLMSPVLGDRVYGSRVQNVMGRMLKISPFTDAAHVQPKLDGNLLEILRIGAHNTKIIPAHVHLREIYLPWFLKKSNDVTITAPLRPEFMWTCERLNLQFNDKDKEDKEEVNCKQSASANM